MNSRDMAKRIGLAFLVLLALLIAAGGLVLAFLPDIAERLARRQLAEMGLTEAQIEVERIGAEDALIRNLSLAEGALRAEEIRLDYRLGDLLQGRVETVTLTGLKIRAEITPQGLELGPLGDLLPKGDGTGDGPAAAAAGRIILENAELLLQTPFGPREVPFDANLAGEDFDLSADLTDLLRGTPLAGETGLVASGQIGDSPSGRLRLQGPRIQADLQVAMQDGAITLAGADALRLSLADPPRADELPEILRANLTGPIAAEVKGLDLRIEPIEAFWRVAGQADIAIESADAAFALAASGSADLLGDLTPRRLEAVTLAAQVDSLALPQGDLTGSIRISELTGSPPVATGGLTLDAVLENADLPDLRAQSLTAQLGGALRMDGFNLILAFDAPGQFRAEDLRLPGLFTAAGPINAALLEDAANTLDIGLAANGGVNFYPNFALHLGEVTGQVRLEDPVLVQANLPRLEIAGQYGTDGARPRLRVAQADIDLPGFDWSAQGVAASLAPDLSAEILVDSLRSTADPALIRPLAAAIQLRPDGDIIAFTANLSAGLLMAELDGRHDLARNEGQAQLRAQPLNFSPEGVQPQGVFPFLGEQVSSVEGAVSARGGLRWSDGRIRPNIEILVKDLSGAIREIGFQRLNTVLTVTNFAPFTTAPNQLAAIGLVDVGFPLTDGRVTYRIRGDVVDISQASLTLAGGSVSVGPTRIGPGGQVDLITLDVVDLDLSQLAQIVDLDGLQASGRLSGQIPLTVIDGTLLINNGELVSQEPGLLRYRPDQVPAALSAGNASVDLLMQALDNFRYKELRVTLNGRAGGELAAGLHLEGANPDLYDGYPVEFNLNVSGALDTILDQALTGYKIPDKLRERMSDFGIAP